jgi:hypothetical protein
MQRRDDGGLGTQLIGDKIAVNHRNVQVTKLLGEGEFELENLRRKSGSCVTVPCATVPLLTEQI